MDKSCVHECNYTSNSSLYLLYASYPRILSLSLVYPCWEQPPDPSLLFPCQIVLLWLHILSGLVLGQSWSKHDGRGTHRDATGLKLVLWIRAWTNNRVLGHLHLHTSQLYSKSVSISLLTSPIQDQYKVPRVNRYLKSVKNKLGWMIYFNVACVFLRLFAYA
jgi:hypothetical protein